MARAMAFNRILKQNKKKFFVGLRLRPFFKNKIHTQKENKTYPCASSCVPTAFSLISRLGSPAYGPNRTTTKKTPSITTPLALPEMVKP